MKISNYSKSQVDNIYFNARMTYGTDLRVNLINNKIARYETTQNDPLVDKASDYYIAVTDFVIPLQNIPISIARVFTKIPNNVDLMTSGFNISYNNANYSEFVTYIPGGDFPKPTQGGDVQVVTPYYFIYSFTQLLLAFNNTLTSLMTTSGVPGAAPYFTITDDELPKIRLIVPDTFINAGAKISVNNAAINYLDAFQYDYVPINNTDYFEFRFYQLDNICDQYGKFNPVGTYHQYTQQYYAIETWSCLSRVLILSSSLPIATQTTSSKNIESPDLVTNTPILYSFYPEINTISQSKSYARYNIQEQYRLTDLISNDPLKKINLQIFWESHEGDFYPIYLRPYECCEIQLGFFKKSLYNNSPVRMLN